MTMTLDTYCRESVQSLLDIIIFIQTVIVIQTKLIEARGPEKRKL